MKAIRILAIALLFLGATPVQAQEPGRIARIGWIAGSPSQGVALFLDAIRDGLAARGWIEGRNYRLEQRLADGNVERVPALALELVREKVDVIIAQGPATVAVSKVVHDIPIVFAFSGDPVSAGFAESLARPTRNMTGVTFMSVELNGKRLALLREVMPALDHVAIIANPSHAGEHLELADSQATARHLGITLQYWQVRNAAEFDAALAGMAADLPQAIVAYPDAVTIQLRERLIQFGIQQGIPTISGWSVFAESGGLFTYGPRLAQSYRRLGHYVDRILNGAKPTDLPIERPTEFELVINLRTANALGIEVPADLLARADEVIE